jgi:hypothetical protein
MHVTIDLQFGKKETVPILNICYIKYVHCAAKLTHNFKTRVFEPNLFPVTTFRTVKY